MGAKIRTELKLFRVKLGLTQEQFAEKLGYTGPAYSQIERGKRKGSLEFWDKFKTTFSVPDEMMWKYMKIS